MEWSECEYKDNGIDSWNEVNLIYSAALKQVQTKMEVLNDEFQHVHRYNPIEHIKSRIKTPESIVKKLKRGGYESTIENMIKYVNDIAGIRIICSFTSDIYRIADMLKRQNDIRVIRISKFYALRTTLHTRRRAATRAIICWYQCRCISLIRWSQPRWRYRFGQSPWTSGRA